MYLVARLVRCSFMVVVVILFLLSLSFGLALSCHPSSLHSHAFLIAIALAILTFLHFRSQSALLSFLDPITIALIGLTKATLSRLLPFSPSWSLSQWPIVIALQNLGPLISAYFVSEKVASHLSTN